MDLFTGEELREWLFVLGFRLLLETRIDVVLSVLGRLGDEGHSSLDTELVGE